MLTTYAIADQWLIYFLRKPAVPFENSPYFLRIEKEQGCIPPGFRPENQANNEVFLKAKKRAGSYFLAYKE